MKHTIQFIPKKTLIKKMSPNKWYRIDSHDLEETSMGNMDEFSILNLKQPKQEWKKYMGDNCPCSDFKIDGIKVYTHCWRTGCCDYSGVHLKGAKAKTDQMIKLGKEIKEYITEGYSTEVRLTVNDNEI